MLKILKKMEVETAPTETVAESKEKDMDQNIEDTKGKENTITNKCESQKTDTDTNNENEIKAKENSTVKKCDSQKNDTDKNNEDEIKEKENTTADTLQRLNPPKPRPVLKLGKRTRQRMMRDNLKRSTSIMPVVSFFNKLKKKREEKKKGTLKRRDTVNK